MTGSSLTIKKAIFILIAVAIVAVVAGVLTAEYIGNLGLIVLALAAGFGGLILYVYASSEAKKIARTAGNRDSAAKKSDSPSRN
jgi:hypothetical protein